MFAASPKARPNTSAPSAKRQAPSAKRQAPSAKRQAPSAKRQAPTLRFVLHGKRETAVLALIVTWGGTLIAIGCDGQGAARPVAPRADTAAQSSLPLVPSESQLNLGEVPAGGKKQVDFWLMNRTDSPVEVAEIETSCDCLTIDMPRRTISPGQKVEGRVLLNLRSQPRFTGKLSIDVKGKGKSEQVVLAMVVKVSVGNE